MLLKATLHKKSSLLPVEPFYSDELRSIWQTYDRDWSVYSKKEMEVSF